MKRKLLVTEIWALGDLVLATPFLKAAASQFEVAVLCKPAGLELQPRFWPGVEVLPFVFPWTAFRGKYRLDRWPWGKLLAVTRRLRARHFDIAVSARPDARDHFVLGSTGAKERMGFPHMGSQIFLTESLAPPAPGAHRYENWRALGRRLGLELPAKSDTPLPGKDRNSILIHTGAAQPAKMWPLDRYAGVAELLRRNNYKVQIACDSHQRQWWLARGEQVCTPGSVTELMALMDQTGLFLGNDSGPGHLAAMMGIPTFTLFGNQFAAAFMPIHPAAQVIEGAPCPYKPCYDSCRFAQPNCLLAISQDDVWARAREFVKSQKIEAQKAG